MFLHLKRTKEERKGKMRNKSETPHLNEERKQDEEKRKEIDIRAFRMAT